MVPFPICVKDNLSLLMAIIVTVLSVDLIFWLVKMRNGE